MDWKSVFSLGANSTETSCSVPLERVLGISNTLLKSLSLLDQEGVWNSITVEIRKLFDCELATLFLIDVEDSKTLRIKSQDPWTKGFEKVELPVLSQKGGGLTGHAAALGKSLALTGEQIKKSDYLKNPNPEHLASKRSYSTLYTPLKNRKGRLIGLLRLNNKNSSGNARSSEFTPSDISVMELIASQIVVHLENASAFDIMRKVVSDVQESGNSAQAIDLILKRTVRLLGADFAKLAVWSRERSKLEVAGVLALGESEKFTLGEEIKKSTPIYKLWSRAAAFKELPKTKDYLNLSLENSDRGDFCREGSQDFISSIVVAHGQPIGVLHLESDFKNAFDEFDKRVLRFFVENLAVGIQSINQSWSDRVSVHSNDGSISPSLVEAKGFYPSIISNLPIVLWRKDSSQKYVWVNQRFCEVIGKKEAEIIGKDDFEVFDKNDKKFAERFRKGDEKAIEYGEFEDREEPYPATGKEERFIHVIKRRITDVLGRPVGTQGMLLDVSEDPVRQMFSKAPTGFFELNEKRELRHVNEAMVKLLGYSEVGLNSRNIEIIFPNHEKDANSKLFVDFFESNETDPKTVSLNLSQGSGKIIPVLIDMRRIVSTSGKKTQGLLCAVRPIRTGPEIEKALLDPDSRYLGRIRELSLPVFFLDKDLKIDFVNQTYQERMGTKSKKVLGKDDIELFGNVIGKRFKEDSKRVFENEIVIDKIELNPGGVGKETKNESERLVRVLKFPRHDANGKIIGVLGVFWELSQQEFAQSELRRAFDEARNEYRRIFKDVSEGIYQADVDGCITGANPAMCLLLGYDSEEELLRQSHPGMDRFCHEPERQYYLKQVETASKSKPMIIEYELKKEMVQPFGFPKLSGTLRKTTDVTEW